VQSIGIADTINYKVGRAMEQLTALLSGNRLTHNIGERFTLDEIVQAHVAVESGKTLGNIILSFTPIAKM
jgi:NADPH:quinone reductase-like Zn-dependent oxidoreductase